MYIKIDDDLRTCMLAAYPKPTKRMQLYGKFMRDQLERRHSMVQSRIRLHRTIAECNENGYVALVESGMDCDGMEYSGHVHTVNANVKDVLAYMDHQLESADGPMHFVIERPSVAADIVSQSRDRGMEAYENGHPYSLYVEDWP